MNAKDVKVILEIICPHCKKLNYINKGDYLYCSVAKDEGLDCWFCDGKSWFAEDLQTLNEEDIWYQKGKKRP